MELEDVLDKTFLGNSVTQWLWAAGIFLAALALCWIVVWLVSKGLHRFARKTTTFWDDIAAAVVDSTNKTLLAFVAAWAAVQVLAVPDWLARAFGVAAVVAIALQVGIWASKSLSEWLKVQRAKKEGEPETLTMLSGVEWVGKVVIWLISTLR